MKYIKFVVRVILNLLSSLCICALCYIGSQHYQETNSVLPFVMVFLYAIGGILNDIAFYLTPTKNKS